MRHQLLAVTATAFLVAPAASAQVGTNAALLNPNLASEAELAAVSHVGPEGAETIIDGRPWLSAAALDAAIGAGLSDEQRGAVYARLWLPINLNDVTDAEIQLIPGVGRRMAHEFEEYRPYVALPEFRREIGKYVDDDEVARLEQYVFVPLNLNTASSEDLATIPGIGPRMIHEFEEYRPYVSIEQFRREIGKYVDDDEVARFERYVSIAGS
ncbi:MAG TPA: helix-hairpin-helix domain-containing protein [Acidobacteriota bacterium]|nr:helix-hairpin-helix domain-containing protein [Acidobacteriota bacterium]